MNTKKFGIVLLGLMFSSFSAMTIAAPNSKANQKAHDKVKEKAKVSIAHCGCNSDGDGLEWKELNVSINAKGHRNHIEGHSTLCTGVDEEGDDVVTTFYRGADDCEISEEGEDLLLLEVSCSSDVLDSLEAAEESDDSDDSNDSDDSVSCELDDETDEDNDNEDEPVAP